MRKQIGVRVTVILLASLDKLVEVSAAVFRRTKNDVINEAVRRYLDAHEAEFQAALRRHIKEWPDPDPKTGG